MGYKLVSEDNVLFKDIDKYAHHLGSFLRNKDVLILKGDMGFGKTTLTRAVAKNFNTDSMVSSPSFTLVNEYNISMLGRKTVLRHIDLYRLNDYKELQDIALEEIIINDGITIIEWGDKFINFFKKPYYILEILFISERERVFKLSLVE